MQNIIGGLLLERLRMYRGRQGGSLPGHTFVQIISNNAGRGPQGRDACAQGSANAAIPDASPASPTQRRRGASGASPASPTQRRRGAVSSAVASAAAMLLLLALVVTQPIFGGGEAAAALAAAGDRTQLTFEQNDALSTRPQRSVLGGDERSRPVAIEDRLGSGLEKSLPESSDIALTAAPWRDPVGGSAAGPAHVGTQRMAQLRGLRGRGPPLV